MDWLKKRLGASPPTAPAKQETPSEGAMGGVVLVHDEVTQNVFFMLW